MTTLLVAPPHSRIRPHRVVAAVLLAGYAVFIARLTLADPSAGSWVFAHADSWATRLSDGQLSWSETEVLANVALFIPAGFLLAIVTGRVVLSAALCLVASVAIELAQARYFPTRVPSLLDVRNNGFGGLLGVLLALPIAMVFRRN